MTRAMLVVGTLAAVTAVAVADPAPQAPGVRDNEVVEKSRVAVEPAGRAFKELVIDNPLGDVRVEGYNGNAIVIETHKHAPDTSALDRLRVSLVPNPDGTVRINTAADASVERPVSRGAVRIDLVIRAPHDARIDATVTGGKVEVVNMDAGGELDTSSGSITVTNLQGTLLTHSVSGKTVLTQVFGSVDTQTLSSDVNLDTINGDKLVASAHRGKIEGRRVRARDIELTTTDGRVYLEAEASLHGRMVVSSLHGDIDVRLRRTGPVVVRARGSKVNFGQGVASQTKPNGWVEMSSGSVADHPATVELMSPLARIDFAFLQ